MSGAYSFSLTTFSPSGKLLQIEYAMNAVKLQGKIALGLRCNEGVVLCAEKKINDILMVGDCFHKIVMLSDHIGMTFSGMPADFRVLVNRSKLICEYYFLNYAVAIPVSELARKLMLIMQEFTQSGGVRPFGCSLLLCGYDHGEYSFYQVDPSGICFPWKVTAIGKNSEHIESLLQIRYKEDMSIDDAISAIVLTMKEAAESQVNENNIEIGICRDGKFTTIDPIDIKALIEESIY